MPRPRKKGRHGGRCLKSSTSTPIKLTYQDLSPVSPVLNSKNNCPCNDYNISNHWIDCHNCGQWWHSRCVSLNKEACNAIVKGAIKYFCHSVLSIILIFLMISSNIELLCLLIIPLLIPLLCR